MARGPTRRLLEKLEKPAGYYRLNYSDLEPSTSFTKGYKRLRRLQAERELKLIFTWPVSIRNKGLDLSIPAHQERVRGFRDWLRDLGIELHCHPALFNLDIDYFLDTHKHLNKYGALIRSENLGHCIKSVLDNGTDPPLGYPQAMAKVKQQEVYYRAQVARLPRD